MERRLQAFASLPVRIPFFHGDVLLTTTKPQRDRDVELTQKPRHQCEADDAVAM